MFRWPLLFLLLQLLPGLPQSGDTGKCQEVLKSLGKFGTVRESHLFLVAFWNGFCVMNYKFFLKTISAGELEGA